MENKMELKFCALSQNESFARATVAGFCLQANPTLDEITDIKTAVSEAVTNCIVHAYPMRKQGEIVLTAVLNEKNVTITIRDFGVGIKDIDRARQPFFTTKPMEERSGMGFTVMESFMDSLKIENLKNGGILVTMSKTFSQNEENLKIG